MIVTNVSIRHSITIFCLMFVILVMGAYSYMTLPRESFPDLKVPYVMVQTTYRGAAPADIETTITKKIEDKLENIAGVDKIMSISEEGMSLIIVQFTTEVDIDDAKPKVREKVDLARPDLPDDADEPVILELNFSDFPVVIYCLSGPVGLESLTEIADNLKDEFEAVSGVLNVQVKGKLEKEIVIEADPVRMANYRIPFDDIFRSVMAENRNVAGGSMRVDGARYHVRIPGEFKTIEDIESVVVAAPDGIPVYLKDFCTIKAGYKEQETIARMNGEPSVSITVSKRTGFNIIDLVRILDERLAGHRPRWPQGTTVVKTLDMSHDVINMVNNLENNMLTGFILVAAVVFVFMGVRNSFLVALAIPFSMLLAFILVQALGLTLNMIVLFSLTLALGMLVDNAIVIVENIYRHADMGKHPVVAAMDGTDEVAWPVITSTITTLAAFFPMVFWPGLMGGFMKYLPLVLIVTLCASLFVALVINPTMCALFIKPGKTSPEQSGEGFMIRTYRVFLDASLRHPFITLSSSVLVMLILLVAYAGFGNGIEFFPETDPREVYVNVDPPLGSDMEENYKLVREVEARVSQIKQIKYVLTTAANSTDPANPTFNKIASDNNVMLKFPDFDQRRYSSQITKSQIAEAVGSVAGAEIRVEGTKHGPPTGKAINVELSGPDFEVLGETSKLLIPMIEAINGAVNVKDDYEKGQPVLRFVPNPKFAATMGLTKPTIAYVISAAVNGLKAGEYMVGNDEYDIIIRLPDEYRYDVNRLLRLYLPNQTGEIVPLLNAVETTYTGGPGKINRLNRKQVVTISGDIVPGANSEEVRGKIAQIYGQLKDERRIPDGVSMAMTGEQEEQRKAQDFLSRAFVVALMLIALVLITQFNSLTMPLIIMMSVGLSIGGVFLGLLITGRPFGVIMTGIGVISLAGVVVNNAIVLIDYIQQLRRSGVERDQAIITAGVTRLRPVLLTAITTILGLIPTAAGINIDFRNFDFAWKNESSQWWAPMAIAVIYGLALATVLTLVVVPNLYHIFDRANHWLAGLLGIRRKIETEEENAVHDPNAALEG